MVNSTQSYQVLARKWRPRNFDELVGQTHVVRTLGNALSQNRLHNAYLFTGARGVGKTTLARILAKCLNCEKGISKNPCGICESCMEIDAGRFLDLIEVDAASKTKVEDTRELLDNVQYMPTKGRYKIYLIDEVHMLSGHSFNAMLKTLEEPPSHVKFLLATTDPQKLPATILSRCLQFHLKNLADDQIASQLNNVLNQEKIDSEESALQALAHAANGSMRDALNLLDQAIAFGDGKVISQDVHIMLGSIERTHLVKLIKALLANDANAMLDTITILAELGADFAQVLEEWISFLHEIAINQAVPSRYEVVSEFAKALTAQTVQLYYQIGLIGRRDLELAPTTKSGFEMVMLRTLSFSPSQIITKPDTTTQPTKQLSSTSLLHTATPINDWSAVLKDINLQGVTKALAEHCCLKKQTESMLVLSLDPGQAPLLNDGVRTRLNNAINQYLGKTMQLDIVVEQPLQQTPASTAKRAQSEKQARAKQSIQKDSNVQAILSQFNGKIMPDSIESVESVD